MKSSQLSRQTHNKLLNPNIKKANIVYSQPSNSSNSSNYSSTQSVNFPSIKSSVLLTNINMEITTFLVPNSASPTIIGKGMCNGIPAYFKIFYNGNDPAKRSSEVDALLYESRIYNLISKQNDEIKKYFIKFLYSGDSTINELHNNNIIKNINNQILIQRMNENKIDKNSQIHIIVTEDSKSESLSDYLEKLTNDSVNNNYNEIKKILNNIFDLVLQGIHILNDTLEIQHNDMHFGNILIKKMNMKSRLAVDM